MASVGERADNMFIAEFGCDVDKQRALEGSPWVVGCYAVILQEYDETLKPSDVSFSSMTMSVHILDLPFGWMNAKQGASVASLIGEVKKVESDSKGKVSGPFLRARVVIDISKPLRSGIMIKKDKSSSPPEWFDIQYENLPFFYFSCGLIGHFESACPSPRPRMQLGNYHMSIMSFVPWKTEGGNLHVLLRQRQNHFTAHQIQDERKVMINPCKILMEQERSQYLSGAMLMRVREMVSQVPGR
jgi:hypothetical protein